MIATDTASHKVSNWNRQTYQRLRLALSLGLRRQLFVAVCDDLSLRDRLVGKLNTELSATSPQASMDAQGTQKLVSLNLNTSDPNLLAQVHQWLAQNWRSQSSIPAPGFQILGIERLTRQPPAVQQLFLRRLQTIERYLPRWESTLLLWLPRPWFHTIQQSVPEFWQWHTGVFDFEGEPTPLHPVAPSSPETSYTPPASDTPPVSEETTGSFKEDLLALLAQDSVRLPPNPLKLEDLSNGEETFNLSFEKSCGEQRSDLKPYTPIANSKEAGKAAEEWKEELKLGQLDVEDDTLGLANATQSEDNHQASDLSYFTPTPSENAAPTENGYADSEHSSQPDNPQPADSTQPSTEEQSPADTYLELGHYYRHAIEQGDASQENLVIAIQAYEQALQFLEDDSPQLSDIFNDLGNLYWMLSRCPGSVEHSLACLEQAIQAYQLALTKLTAEEAPQTYAMIQNNLGAAYSDLARYNEPAENLELSIRAYEEALHYRKSDSDPLKYASTQNNLGTAYWHLAQHQSPVQNLRAAIAAYAEALCYYNTQTEPLNWAMIQNNLGTAYWNLAQYEQPETWLQLATLAYQDALTYRTPEAAPTAYAATQNNLGTAYWHLADRFQDDPEQREKYLQQCIVAYESAIALAEELSHHQPPIPVNFDIFATRNNLGLAHYQVATASQFSLTEAAKYTHLEAALDQHVQACAGVAARSDAYQIALSYIIKTIRAFYNEGGITGQNRALSRVPGQLLPEILPRL